MLKIFGKILRVYLVCGKILITPWQFFAVIQLSFFTMAKYFHNNLAIWSHFNSIKEFCLFLFLMLKLLSTSSSSSTSTAATCFFYYFTTWDHVSRRRRLVVPNSCFRKQPFAQNFVFNLTYLAGNSTYLPNYPPTYLPTSVTRFGEISPLWHNVKTLWPFWKCSFSIWPNFELNLANL